MPRPRRADHWHAAFGINVCGEFQPDISAFETRAGTEEVAGIHSHADGLIHIHPLAPNETGRNATIGRYLDYAGGSISEDSIAVPDGLTFSNGDRCRDGRVGSVRWSVNGEEREGDPAEFKPEDRDVVVVVSCLRERTSGRRRPQRGSRRRPIPDRASSFGRQRTVTGTRCTALLA